MCSHPMSHDNRRLNVFKSMILVFIDIIVMKQLSFEEIIAFVTVTNLSVGDTTFSLIFVRRNEFKLSQ